MRTSSVVLWCVIAFVSWQGPVSGQVSPQTPTQSPVQTGPRTSSPSQPYGDRARTKLQIKATGCVERESEYLHGKDAAIIGEGDEFVLVNATTTSGSSSSAKNGAGTAAGVKTAETSGTTTYRLTGQREDKLAGSVGKRVEIVGTLKDDKLDVTSFRTVNGTCER